MKYGLAISSKGLEEWYDSLHHRLDALLREPSITMSQIVQASTNYFKQLVDKTTTAVVTATHSAINTTTTAGSSSIISSSPPLPRLPADWESELTRALHHVVTENNPILNLFFKVLYILRLYLLY